MHWVRRVLYKESVVVSKTGRLWYYAIDMGALLFEKLARLEGFEPTTPGSEDRCSNPLSYRRWGGRRDSNPRSPGPQPGALNLWATPTTVRPF